MAVEAPSRTRIPAGVTVDQWDEAQMELASRRHEALSLCDALEPRLTRLHGVVSHLGPQAEQLAAGALYDVVRYRVRNAR